MGYEVNLPNYSVGTDAYDSIGKICSKYGNKIVAIGGKTAISVAKEKISASVANTDMQILDFIWYGGEASYENVEKLKSDSRVIEADMLFAIGGGKATDTVKTLADLMGKPVFTFPTIGSNCSACTAVSIMYREDGVFLKPHFFNTPPNHAFIDTEIIAASPARYMWAGIGDTYAKYFESAISSRDEAVPHYVALGVTTARMCYEPMLQYGKKALEDMEKHISSTAFEQVLLSIIVSTGIASILLTKDQIIDYNTGLGHAIFYALTSFPQIEENHLHGEVVAFGILVLLLVDNDMDNFNKVYEFNKCVGLPTRLEDIEISKEDLNRVALMASEMKDIDHNPYKVTEEMIREALVKLENM